MKVSEKVRVVVERLVPLYWDEHLYSNDPFRVLISTIISQRTKDEQTYGASERLLKAYPTPEAILEAGEEKVAEMIRNTGFYRQKARRIVKTCKMLIEKYGGKVPSTMDELLTLPGVGRKTAGCVLAYGFGKDALPVDTHVHRIANRLGFVSTKKPEETEMELKKLIPKELWRKVNLTLVRFGQQVCRPLKPRCGQCPVRDVCNWWRENKNETNSTHSGHNSHK